MKNMTQNDRSLLYYYEHRDKILERNNTIKNKLYHKQYNQEYYQKNKESINEKRRVRREKLIMMGLMRRPEPKHLPINNNTKPSFKGGNPFILKL